MGCGPQAAKRCSNNDQQAQLEIAPNRPKKNKRIESGTTFEADNNKLNTNETYEDDSMTYHTKFSKSSQQTYSDTS